MKDYAQVAEKIFLFLNRLSTGRLILILFFGLAIAITLNPEVWKITLDYLLRYNLLTPAHTACHYQ